MRYTNKEKIYGRMQRCKWCSYLMSQYSYCHKKRAPRFLECAKWGGMVKDISVCDMFHNHKIADGSLFVQLKRSAK